MKKAKFSLIFLLPILFLLCSCDFYAGNERVYQSSDQDRMENLVKLLNLRGIPYVYADGMIRYQRNVEEDFKKAESAFDSVTSVQFIDPEVRGYFHTLLATEGVEFIEPDRDGSTWTLWWAGSEDKRNSILDQVAEYKHSLLEEEASDCETDSNEASTEPSFIQGALDKLDMSIKKK